MFVKRSDVLSDNVRTKMEVVPEPILNDAYSLLDCLLDPNHKKRISAINSLNHPFFEHFNNF